MGMYELVFVVILIILATYMWIGLGYYLKSAEDIVISLGTSDSYADWYKPADWAMIGFTVFLFYITILAYVWAVKR